MSSIVGLGRVACVFTFALGALANMGCAGHEARVRDSLTALDRGSMPQAIAALDRELGVKSAGEIPKVTRDKALLLLDRGSVHLAMGAYERASRDFGAADQAIEVLDLSTSAASDLGRYVFSDDAGPYKAPAYEKLLLNTLNMMSYLARRDLVGARVEARRLAIMQGYITSQGDESALLGFGSYLAGFTFEKSNQRDEALLYYDEALRVARYGSLRDPLRALAHGREVGPSVEKLIADKEPLPPVEETGEAEIVVIVGSGRVPPKIPVRIPIGMALRVVGDELSPMERRDANALMFQGEVSWINYPSLGPGRGSYETPAASIGEAPMLLEQALDVENEVRAAWHKREGTLVLAAITRLLARTAASVAVAGATTAAVHAGQSDPRRRSDGSAEALGMLLGLATSLTLSSLDTPDTRSWSTLPARIAIGRTRVAAGTHAVTIEARGQKRTFEVKVPAGGWALVPFFVLR